MANLARSELTQRCYDGADCPSFVSRPWVIPGRLCDAVLGVTITTVILMIRILVTTCCLRQLFKVYDGHLRKTTGRIAFQAERAGRRPGKRWSVSFSFFSLFR